MARSDPAAGTEQLRGSTVELLVSSGRPQVPDIAAWHRPCGRHRRADRCRPDGRRRVDAGLRRRGAGRRRAAHRPGRRHPTAGQRAGHAGAVRRAGAGQGSRRHRQVAEDAANKLVVDGFTVGRRTMTLRQSVAPGTVLGTTPGRGDVGAARHRGVAADCRCAGRPRRTRASRPRTPSRSWKRPGSPSPSAIRPSTPTSTPATSCAPTPVRQQRWTRTTRRSSSSRRTPSASPT